MINNTDLSFCSPSAPMGPENTNAVIEIAAVTFIMAKIAAAVKFGSKISSEQIAVKNDVRA